MSVSREYYEGNGYYHYIDPLNRNVTLVKEDGKLTKIVTSYFQDLPIVQTELVQIAVLGDIHGHITLGLSQLEDWIRFSGRGIDAILQVGDIGAYGPHSVLDRTTMEMGEKDPAELEFKCYHRFSRTADRFFSNRGSFADIPFIFINGNHDDTKFLKQNMNQADNHIGDYSQLRFLPSGTIYPLRKGSHKVQIASLGWDFDRAALNQLQREPNIDILLTHDVLKCPETQAAIFRTTEVIPDLNPRFHFFGHKHELALACSNPLLNSYGLNEVAEADKAAMQPGWAGILQINRIGQSFFFYLPADKPQTYDDQRV